MHKLDRSYPINTRVSYDGLHYRVDGLFLCGYWWWKHYEWHPCQRQTGRFPTPWEDRIWDTRPAAEADSRRVLQEAHAARRGFRPLGSAPYNV